ncbi:type I 3-dehydroquinate dehydratase [Methanocaldococcus infernus]
MIALPVVERKVKDSLRVAEEYLKVADIVEFRLDYLEEVSLEDIGKFCKFNSIITIRPTWEGGYWDKGERVELFKKAIEENAKFIDVELREEKNKELVEFRNRIGSKTKVIISYHNFEETPSFEKLCEVVENSLKVGDIAKIATMVKDKEDVLKILNLANKYRGRIIAIGMGEKGRLTRILAPYFGSILTFASYKGKSSAPGQIEIEELKEIWRKLRITI